jgi:hypothetical protein
METMEAPYEWGAPRVEAPSMHIHHCQGIRGREELHCMSRDESRQAYEAYHIG